MAWLAARSHEAARPRHLRLSLRRRPDRPLDQGLADGRPDVRGILHSAAAALALPDRDDPRQLADRHQLHRHAGRPRRLGAIFPAARLRGLRGRPGGARPLRALVAVARSGCRSRTSRAPRALRRAQALRALAAGARHTQWPGTGKAGRRRCSTPSTQRSFSRWSDNEKVSRRSTAMPAVALLDRIGPAIAADAFAVGRLRLADRRRAAEARQGARRDRAERPAGVRHRRCTGRRDWFEDTGPRKSFGPGFMPLTYDPPLKRGEKLAFVRQDEPDAPGLVRGWLQQEPARQAARTLPAFRS